jgi:hypothetical protein
MKKIFKILLTFILLFSVGITTAFAAVTPVFRAVGSDNLGAMKNAGHITTDWYNATDGHDLCAASPSYSCKEIYGNWNLYSVQVGFKHYILYCLNLSKDIVHDDDMTEYDDLDSARFSDPSLSESEKAARKELLKKLLLYGYNPDPTNHTPLSTLITNDPKAQLKLIAMQILVWEVMEGGRTTFDTEAPQWNGTYSFYNQVIKPNGKDSDRTDTLYYYYNKFRNDARLGDQANPSPAFDTSTYTLTWDNANQKYQRTISGIGDYNSCKSNSSKVNVTVDGNDAIVTASEEVDDVTITCKYYRGTGASTQDKEESFKYFKFDTDTDSTQDMVYGSGWKIYTKSFKVQSENIDIAIKKQDEGGRALSNVKFTLSHVTNTSYRGIEITSGSSAKTLKYSGKYTVSENKDTVPKGYKAIQDFNITLDGDTKKVTSCDGQGTRNGKMTCLGGQVVVDYNDGVVELTIINITKNFNILKVDKNGNTIKGATFEIRDSQNRAVKFNRGVNNTFEYSANGSITSITDSSLSSYSITLLEEGDYSIVETAVPSPYRLSSNEDSRTTKIKLDADRNLFVFDKSRNTYVSQADLVVKIINYTTKFTIHKVGHSNPLEGVQFELYNSDKTVKIKCNMVSPGVYNYIDNQNSVENSIYITNSNGDITINNLPEGIYWAKEVATISPYVLPTGDAVYTQIEVKIDSKGVSINNSYTNNTIEISNTPNSFNFYKKDTEGNALTTGKYKLQKYDTENNKYVDLKLVEVQNDGSYNANTVIYEVDEEHGKIQFTLTKGVATFINMESSTTYRIVETVAPEGYTKASTKDTATVYIDEYGNASGLLVLVDQKIVKEDDSAFAELIINVQTGKERIMYGAIIVVVIGIIAGLIIYNKKK